ncbi:DNA-3-methyladenine glycosylase I [Erysipelothrix tonsillarum]|uniref:DNA-3-methyladenine glycosylase I n=1 Tax=Erysipelothrix tonsillarum TaxID=38402 RepID=UPI000360CD14|nr:DNA-3-methyladenine glycosylase I [Erysipelothrix tonsillarum]
MDKKRCEWANRNPLEMMYHDTEWGRKSEDERYLFEMLILEGQQSGLSWTTIISKREGMRKAYANFEPARLIQFTEADVDRLVENPNIIRHRLKIKAVISNAHAYYRLTDAHDSLAKFLWRYVDYKPIVNHYETMSDVPASTPLSTQISKDLKRLGFKFVGPTTIYALMQAIGMVDDHLEDCFLKYKD